jgi:hypothetical protein
MPTDLRPIIAGLLPEGDDRLATAVREAVLPIVVAAFRQGLQRGIEMAREAADAGIDETLRAIELAFEPMQREAPRSKQDRRQQVPRGTIGPLINFVLAESPGLKAAEVEERVVEHDPTISAASVGNELRRQRDRRYRRDGTMRWFLIGDTEQVTGLARQPAVPVALVGEPGAGTPASGSPAERAA